MLHSRYLDLLIRQDAFQKGKMAFVMGPRQCGKTTLSKQILKQMGQPDFYFTWDDDEFRQLWLQSPTAFIKKIGFPLHQKRVLVLDELHKHDRWKSALKGVYDLFQEKINFLVTGSARLDFFRKSGESLQGRYFPYRLHPFSLAEVNRIKKPPRNDWFEDNTNTFALLDLLELGGFPEPLLRSSKLEAQRWRRLHRQRMIREDLRDLKWVKDLQTIENLALLLETTVGSTLSYRSLQEDLQVAFGTIQDWIHLLESVYYCFRLKPYTRAIRRSLKKEPKLFLFDWAAVQKRSARLENLIACHLLKACHFWTDSAQGEFDLFYIRDKEKREVDFLITENGAPYAMIEVKSGEENISPSLYYYTNLLKPRFSFQLVSKKTKEKRLPLNKNQIIHQVEVSRFLSALV